MILTKTYYGTDNTTADTSYCTNYIIYTYIDDPVYLNYKNKIIILKQRLFDYLKNITFTDIFSTKLVFNNNITRVPIIRRMMFSLSGYVQKSARKKLKDRLV